VHFPLSEQSKSVIQVPLGGGGGGAGKGETHRPDSFAKIRGSFLIPHFEIG
jgi:hypothetical protein